MDRGWSHAGEEHDDPSPLPGENSRRRESDRLRSRGPFECGLAGHIRKILGIGSGTRLEGREGARAAAARIARGWTKGASEKRAADGQGDAGGEEACKREAAASVRGRRIDTLARRGLRRSLGLGPPGHYSALCGCVHSVEGGPGSGAHVPC